MSVAGERSVPSDIETVRAVEIEPGAAIAPQVSFQYY
jgi:hypothetical protein